MALANGIDMPLVANLESFCYAKVSFFIYQVSSLDLEFTNV